MTNYQNWLAKNLSLAYQLPFSSRPKYFFIIIASAYKALCEVHFDLVPFICDGCELSQQLYLGAAQMYGGIPSAGLNPERTIPGVAAGLPHFATGYMRCWGRDVFVTLPGLYIITKQFDVARQHLLSFAGSLKHGLLPNLLDSCSNPRYNARDAVWWFLQSLQEYCESSPEGSSILKTDYRYAFSGR